MKCNGEVLTPKSLTYHAILLAQKSENMHELKIQEAERIVT